MLVGFLVALFYKLILAVNQNNVINFKLTKMLETNQKESYFGYSILLQKGNPSLAIVGAPKYHYNNKTTGSIFQCDLNSLNCKNIPINLSKNYVYYPNFTGDLLGIAIDGGNSTTSSFFTCAPRSIQENNNIKYYTPGHCIGIRNKKLELFEPMQRQKLYESGLFDSAFAQVGFDVKYIRENAELITSGLGKNNWHGSIIKLKYQTHSIAEEGGLGSKQISYTGYAIAYGRFIKNSSKIWYVAGAPRHNNLAGKVIFLLDIISKNFHKSNELLGDEIGSYFGSSLLVLPQTNGGDDILVGAPMAAGNSFDEGCVYYYKNQNTGSFNKPLKLAGRQTGSRFGTVMSFLGDIDLDGFQDVAIAAPFEDDGVGAVYIFFKLEQNDIKSFQRISPSDFQEFIPKKTLIKGFGLGISNGVDLNNIIHKNFIVGAFRSDQIFLLQPIELVDYKGTINLKQTTLYRSTTQLSFEYCFISFWRNNLSLLETNLTVRLSLSNARIQNNRDVDRFIGSKHNKSMCWNHILFLTSDLADLSPVLINLEYKTEDLKKFSTLQTKSLQVSRECGKKQLCQIDLSLEASTNTSIVLGTINEVKVNVEIKNSADISAYEVELLIQIKLPQVEFINSEECILQNGNYTCSIAQILQKNKTILKPFFFDISKIPADVENFDIVFFVNTTDFDTNIINNKAIVNFKLILENNPFIYGESKPSGVKNDKIQTTAEISHIFKLGNEGPSPVGIDLMILVPRVLFANKPIFEVEEIDNELGLDCVEQNRTLNANNLTIANVAEGLLFSCDDENETECSKFICQGGYLEKSSKITLFTLKLNVRIDYLTKLFLQENGVSFGTFAVLRNGNGNWVNASAVTLFYDLKIAKISIWVYIVAISLGTILLALATFILYKCNFFKRTYKEKIINKTSSMELDDNEDNTLQEDI